MEWLARAQKQALSQRHCIRFLTILAHERNVLLGRRFERMFERMLRVCKDELDELELGILDTKDLVILHGRRGEGKAKDRTPSKRARVSWYLHTTIHPCLRASFTES